MKSAWVDEIIIIDWQEKYEDMISGDYDLYLYDEILII